MKPGNSVSLSLKKFVGGFNADMVKLFIKQSKSSKTELAKDSVTIPVYDSVVEPVKSSINAKYGIR